MITIRQYEAPSISEREILRYAGATAPSAELLSLLRTCLGEIEGKLSYRVCFTEAPVALTEEGLSLGFATVESAALCKNLQGCERAVVFAATVGLELDRMIAKAARLSPAKALLLQAIGAERIEALCDRFCQELSEELAPTGQSLRPRFSPGYGDLPLTFQEEIFRVLDCPRKIGLSLNESLLMSPTKSVTALVGITRSTE